MSNKKEELLTTDEVAALLKVNPLTVQLWRTGKQRKSTPKIPYIRIGSLVRYKMADVQAYIDDHVVASV